MRKLAQPGLDRYRVGTLEKGLSVLEKLEKSARPMNIQELALSTGIQRAAVFRLLCTLERRGYVERLENKKYHPVSRRRRDLVGYCAPLTGSAFRVDVVESLRRAAQQGGVDLMVIDNQEHDADNSVKNARLLVQAKVDVAVLFQPVEWIGHAMADCFLEAGIPFVTIDVPFHGGVYFGANNYQAGRLAGQVLAEFALRNWKGRFDGVVLVESSLASTNVQARLGGVLVRLREMLGPVEESRVTHLDGRAQVEHSREVMLGFLARRRRGERLLIACFNDQTAIGALGAVREAGQEQNVAIVGHNATEESWEEIRNPQSRFIASIAYFPERYGGKLVRLVRSMLNREPVPPAVYTEHLVLDGANIERFYSGKLVFA